MSDVSRPTESFRQGFKLRAMGLEDSLFTIHFITHYSYSECPFVATEFLKSTGMPLLKPLLHKGSRTLVTNKVFVYGQFLYAFSDDEVDCPGIACIKGMSN